MRTTVNVDEHVLAEAKQLAARTHRPLGAVVDDALRRFMADLEASTEVSPVRLPVDHRQGWLRPGVDLDDKEALATMLGDNEFPRADR